MVAGAGAGHEQQATLSQQVMAVSSAAQSMTTDMADLAYSVTRAIERKIAVGDLLVPFDPRTRGREHRSRRPHPSTITSGKTRTEPPPLSLHPGASSLSPPTTGPDPTRVLAIQASTGSGGNMGLLMPERPILSGRETQTCWDETVENSGRR